MGHTGIGAGDHDGIKGQTVGAILVQAVDQLGAQLLLGHANLNPLQHLGERGVGNLLGLLHNLNLPGLLDATEGVDFALEGNQRGGELFLIATEFGHRQVVLLEAQLPDAEVGAALVDKGAVTPVGAYHQDLEALQIVFRGFDVAAVREVPAAFFGDHGNALGDVKLGGIHTAVSAG